MTYYRRGACPLGFQALRLKTNLKTNLTWNQVWHEDIRLLMCLLQAGCFTYICVHLTTYIKFIPLWSNTSHHWHHLSQRVFCHIHAVYDRRPSAHQYTGELMVWWELWKTCRTPSQSSFQLGSKHELSLTRYRPSTPKPQLLLKRNGKTQLHTNQYTLTHTHTNL